MKVLAQPSTGRDMLLAVIIGGLAACLIGWVVAATAQWDALPTLAVGMALLYGALVAAYDQSQVLAARHFVEHSQRVLLLLKGKPGVRDYEAQAMAEVAQRHERWLAYVDRERYILTLLLPGAAAIVGLVAAVQAVAVQAALVAILTVACAYALLADLTAIQLGKKIRQEQQALGAIAQMLEKRAHSQARGGQA